MLPALTALRGISFTHEVPVTVIDDAKARKYALDRFHKMMPDDKIRADQTVYRLLGLVPPDTDVLKTLLDVLEEQAGGFYDPTTKSFYLLDDMPRSMTAFLAAHEMTHALEDQKYDIDGMLDKRADDDDASFAVSALGEGSATIASLVWLRGAAEAGTISAADLANAGDMDKLKSDRLDAMPASLRRELIGPYVLGMSFLLRGKPESIGGEFPRADVDAAWAKPPRSSEQILHPEKYWDPAKRDEPKPVTIPDPAAVLGPGWKKQGTGIFGELTIGSLVGADAPGAEQIGEPASAWTNTAASGWGGDRYELWSKGDASVVLALTTWDTERDAKEFEAALAAKAGAITAKLRGKDVAFLAGAPADKRAALLDRLLAR